eukprot:sb/3475907/
MPYYMTAAPDPVLILKSEIQTNHPHPPLSLYYYYMVSGAFYLSLLVSQFHDTKRKDFWEMFLHHIATLALIGGSWIGGGYRIGSIIMVIHDIADVFLETAKLGIYLKYEMLSNVHKIPKTFL